MLQSYRFNLLDHRKLNMIFFPQPDRFGRRATSSVAVFRPCDLISAEGHTTDSPHPDAAPGHHSRTARRQRPQPAPWQRRAQWSPTERAGRTVLDVDPGAVAGSNETRLPESVVRTYLWNTRNCSASEFAASTSTRITFPLNISFLRPPFFFLTSSFEPPFLTSRYSLWKLSSLFICLGV